MTKALITGITGQDGSYLAEFLLGKGYEVFGLVRKLNAESFACAEFLRDKVQWVGGDLMDQPSLARVLREVKPDEVYNLAAQSFVPTSWDQPAMTMEVTGLGPVRLLDAIRHETPWVRFYQASSSEMFGSSPGPQNERTRFHPRSPYGVAKVNGHWATVNHRESYSTFAVSGILFNHESPRRGKQFVTRKITRAVAAIRAGKADHLALGNLDAKRDWGFAGDYVEAMWLMLQQDEPNDFVIGTGRTHSVREFVEAAFEVIDADYRDFVRLDPRFVRPAEVDCLQADPKKAREVLSWEPTVSFKDLVRMMVMSDLEAIGWS